MLIIAFFSIIKEFTLAISFLTVEIMGQGGDY